MGAQKGASLVEPDPEVDVVSDGSDGGDEDNDHSNSVDPDWRAGRGPSYGIAMPEIPNIPCSPVCYSF